MPRTLGRGQGRPSPKVYAFLGEDPEPAGRTLGERIRSYRRRHGFSQRDLARRLDLDPETLGRYEKGSRAPGADLSERLEDRLRGES